MAGATNGGLEDLANREGIEAKFASAKSDDQGEGESIGGRSSHRKANGVGNLCQDTFARGEGETRQGWQRHGEKAPRRNKEGENTQGFWRERNLQIRIQQ